MTDLQTITVHGLSIGGTERPAASGRTFDVIDPATGAVIARVADAGADDARAAVAASHAAAEGWRTTPARERSRILRRAFDAVTARAEEFAAVITAEMGKPLSDSRGEVAYGAGFLEWFAEEAVRINGRTAAAPAGTGQIVVTHEPVGLCYAVTPWNFPLAMITRKVGPALAAGNTMIVKPAAETPLTALLLAQVLAEAGLPEGVLSVLPCSAPVEVSDALFAEPDLAKITFTGSTAVGRKLLAAAAPGVLRTSMELGGNAPFLVFEDADLDAALDGAMLAKMRNGGQACTAANRFLVHESVRAEFVSRLTERIAALTVGAGAQAGSEIGPLISEKQRATVAALVDEAVADGAVVRTGGTAIDGPGHFYAPTVLDEVPAGARILREEIFGPVATVRGFTDEAAAIAEANDTEYGLAAYFYTRDASRVQRVGAALRSGMVGVNRGLISDPAAPFGGVKASGIGAEGGSEGIGEYLNVKYLALPAV
ncbi:NAD-dependent succinate-semialdehyde dehydrogenase [Tsukamurella strandjordii]|uniref:NAD-dependent succinate-semialdehyde dehydrogenase n=1 Tax=Tsukamurella strandjordii TaxID=147577 RepID=A0AA90SR58_9ACTN|nr:NAD-dependent succinate-semialdehyde dehydrogenase [Tsukamurella strandjordii]MDP0398616.1 NAD-dependent succinate-semialdehyde dehydrogenase [Tsukamurella strandjordii]